MGDRRPLRAEAAEDGGENRIDSILTAIAVIAIPALGVAGVLFLPGLLAATPPIPDAATVDPRAIHPAQLWAVIGAEHGSQTTQPTSAPATANANPGASPRFYRIRVGDTLAKIARRFGITVEEPSRRTRRSPTRTRSSSAGDHHSAAMSGGKGSEPTTEPLTFEELQLAGRNRGMPLEALRYDITPTGLHYLLIHFDIPAIDIAASATARSWRRGTRAEPQFRGHPGTAAAHGDGDHGMRRQRPRPTTPRPLSQPWLVEAIGTARWTGASCATSSIAPDSPTTRSSWCSAQPTGASRARSSTTTSAA